jgi:lipopolysaccharide export system protein LptA
MKGRSHAANLALFLVVACVGAIVHAQTQTAPENHLGGSPSIATYRGGVPEYIMRASNWNRLSDRDLLGVPFEMTLYRTYPNQVQLIVEAPACHIDSVSNVAWDEGHIVLFTPTTNIFVQGDGFFFTESNHTLTISNNVETRVVKALLQAPLLSGAPSNGVSPARQIMKIFSGFGVFVNDSNRVDYSQHVHVIDPQMDLTSQAMTVQLTTNGTVESVLARHDVVITTTNKGRATGNRGFYYVTNMDEITEMTGDATWENGDEEAQAEYFMYDSVHHFLIGSNHVCVRWPNAAPGTNQPPPGTAPQAGTNGFRELFADYATLQMPPTNGPVESMNAVGNVMITNQADHSRATGERAVYSQTNDSFELTGDPVWWNGQMEIQGRLLRAELTNRLYRARGDARLKLNVAGTAQTNAAQSSRHSTNQWLNITSADLDYQTNLATFRDHVVARLLEGDSLRDTLWCDRLVVTLESNQVIEAVASGRVRGRMEPNIAGVVKTIVCSNLTGYRTGATGLMRKIVAETNVVLMEFGTGARAATNQLTGAVVTAYFSPVTNRIEVAVAESDVVLDQWKAAQFTHATGDRAVYTVTNDRVNLTGTPLGHTESYSISNADCLIWHPKTNRFEAVGRYNFIPIKVKTNQPAS